MKLKVTAAVTGIITLAAGIYNARLWSGSVPLETFNILISIVTFLCWLAVLVLIVSKSEKPAETRNKISVTLAILAVFDILIAQMSVLFTIVLLSPMVAIYIAINNMEFYLITILLHGTMILLLWVAYFVLMKVRTNHETT